MEDEELFALVRRVALENAVRYGGQATAGSVMGGVMGAHAELRAEAARVKPLAERAVAEVNALDAAAQQAALDALGGAAKRAEKKARHPFKPLPRFAEHERVVLRFAPNPNGPATLGHSRGMVTMSEYKRLAREAGKDAEVVLRFDDTDPQVKPPYPPAYEWLVEDYEWLYADRPELRPDRVIRASDRVPEYYQVAEALIERDAAYVCSCGKEEAQANRKEGRACPHRDQAAAKNREAWRAMIAGDVGEGAATLRIKTQVDHRDPALRDWVAFRIAKTPHPMVGDRYKVWPMLDFESAVEDHLQGVTHIIRGKDLMDSTRRQVFLYEHMGWKYPETLYWGRVRIDEAGKFSSSGMRRDIAAGVYSGWDDPRLPTLRALRRRGIRATAIRRFWVNMGLSEKDVAASLVNLYAENERLVQDGAPRLFFVPDPTPVAIAVPAEAAPEGRLAARSPLHPDHPERGVRVNEVPVVDGVARVLVARADLASPGKDGLVRLKDLGNLRLGADGNAAWVDAAVETARGARAPIVQWVPDGEDASVPVEILRPEASDRPGGQRHHGRAEPAVRDASPDSVVQFERYGYARIEATGPDGVRAVYAHR